ncbi:signal peptide peptidase SppA [Pararhizobium sp. IMCC21322]|uniref:signal peptide peptidase SppA n=1 Tax=Pararhizobium sp. IMCC21322 TaxID=3067903 RepID=UPI0027415659|nr:signal peptide peptidase SppA [Pararhizobium sp. IMCC21322]
MAEPSNPDYILDRRRLRRKLTFWRIAGLVLLGFVLIAGIARLTGLDPLSASRGEHIAEIAIDGVIVGARERLDLIEELGSQDNVQAVIVKINSPGGTTSGGEALYEALLTLSAKKPVVATIDGVGASAAYMAALATDRIYARRASITGSIGVVYQSPNISELMGKLGIRMEQIKSAPLKASPNPFSPTSPEAREAIQNLINDSYEWFLDLVKERRNFDDATARDLADGRVYSGDRALSTKLIDAIGSKEQAREWLVLEHGLDTDIEVIRRDFDEAGSPLTLAMRALFVTFATTIGLQGGDSGFLSAVSAPAQLDGLISVWHPILD